MSSIALGLSWFWLRVDGEAVAVGLVTTALHILLFQGPGAGKQIASGC